MGLSAQMPGFEGALSDERIEELVTHLKSLADAARYPPGDLNYLRPVLTTKAFPEDEALIINRFERGSAPESDSLRTTLYYARRLGARYQGEIKLSHLAPEAESAELDEVELGFKWAVHDDLARESLLTLGLEAAFPIEDSSASEEMIPYFSMAQGVSDSVTFQGQLKAKLPVDEVGDGEARLSGIFHWMPSMWPRSVSPALELAVTEPFDRDRDTEVTLLPQLYFGLTKGGHVAFVIGAELPLTDLDYDYRIHAFILWDIADGPFWVGW